MPKIDTSRCMGAKAGDDRIFADRCQELAAYATPAGPRCEACASREMQTIREGSCLLAVHADANNVPRERLIAQYRRLQ